MYYTCHQDPFKTLHESPSRSDFLLVWHCKTRNQTVQDAILADVRPSLFFLSHFLSFVPFRGVWV
jgi:hypothetical protein